MTFDEWWRAYRGNGLLPNVARAAWDAALEEAARIANEQKHSIAAKNIAWEVRRLKSGGESA